MPNHADNSLLSGREDEIAAFVNELTKSSGKRLINIYGTAGIGKSYLMEELVRQARMRDTLVFFLDGDSFAVSPSSFCKQLWTCMGNTASDDDESWFDRCLIELCRIAEKQRVVLFLDAYERMDEVDQWLRNYFLKHLHLNVLIVIAGRSPLSEPWLLSPVWRQIILRIQLTELTYEEVEHYAVNNGIRNNDDIHRLWRYSQGHPLTMSLFAFFLQEKDRAGSAMEFSDHEPLHYIIEQWLREVPGVGMRPIIEAASVLRYFNQESLSFVINEEISNADFRRLVRFSFVRKVDRGWTIHPLMRDSINKELFARAPKHYEQIRNHAMRYFYQSLLENHSLGSDDSKEMYELQSFIGDALIRSFLNWFEVEPRRFEPIGEYGLEELERYVERRFKEAKDSQIELYDLHSNQYFRYHISKKEACYTAKWLDFRTLFSLGYDVIRVMRDNDGSIIGLATIIPINRKTLPYLRECPRGKAYFTGLSEEQVRRFAVPENERAGWFIETIDTVDYSDKSQQTAVGYLLYSVLLSGELVIESPAPLPYYIDTHLSLGFEIVPHGTHTNYDGITPTPTFVLNLDKNKLLRKAQKMLQISQPLGDLMNVETFQVSPQSAAHEMTQTMQGDNLHASLTAREREVANLLEEGLTNLEIASRLFVSEATVKKHMKSMLHKLGAANRTQLLKKLMRH
ncbi:LuxR C-terminal-related transcriptional regulator [Xylanibacillus composti]|uniref:LuxR C-terminal-related transcriptional regulator n=1 Tax=Xylanibacillus composti TaxID=1572762 RepID=UPI0028F71B3A|nr:LuxR C-terminal-related transcriptional regulator [Xylanibacillus composti]